MIEAVKRAQLKTGTFKKPIKLRYDHMIEDAVGVDHFGAEMCKWKPWRSTLILIITTVLSTPDHISLVMRAVSKIKLKPDIKP